MARTLVLFLSFVALLAESSLASAQNDAILTPERTRSVVEALGQSEWEALGPGLEGMELMAGSVGITALRIDPARYSFSIALQSGQDGERVDDFGKQDQAEIAINGGFFGEKEPGKGLFPVGYLKIGKKRYSQAWSRSGGYLVIRDGRPSITPSMDGIPDNANAVLQSKPLLIEPGGVWAMNTNLGNLRRRSLVCLQDDDKVVLVVITGLGMSLFEAGWLMRGSAVGGYFECDAALALDGGGSTQLWLREEKLQNIRGDNAVHNALLISPR